jgi:signal transduction histidine kinase
METIMKVVILAVGWPVLITMTCLICKKGINFYKKLKGTVIGKLIIPTVGGWIYGMYMLGIVATNYMLETPWYFSVIPAFLTFMIAIFIVYRTIGKWETEATELQSFYKNLEDLVEKRTKELEQAHEKQMKNEKEIQKLKDQFVYIAAHELKTPITAIRWSLEMALEQGKEKLDPDILGSLETIQGSNERLITLVEDLLNVARIEAGSVKFDLEEFDVHDVIAEGMGSLTSLFATKDIKAEYDPKPGIEVFADKKRVKLVLQNFLSNAVKYNKEKGTIQVTLAKEGDFARISVKDSGIGIKKEDMKKLFVKFGKIDSGKKPSIESTGLGLYLSKEIVTKLGGEINVESEFEKGSTFSFTVPLIGTEVAKKLKGTKKEKPGESKYDDEGKRVEGDDKSK